ncbi:hypothetical protein P9112_004504 [Eukaryota sp. TZLM1-RC]
MILSHRMSPFEIMLNTVLDRSISHQVINDKLERYERNRNAFLSNVARKAALQAQKVEAARSRRITQHCQHLIETDAFTREKQERAARNGQHYLLEKQQKAFVETKPKPVKQISNKLDEAAERRSFLLSQRQQKARLFSRRITKPQKVTLVQIQNRLSQAAEQQSRSLKIVIEKAKVSSQRLSKIRRKLALAIAEKRRLIDLKLQLAAQRRSLMLTR